ncbi:MAG: L-threonylcarbamoyladenylate synthase [Acidobacteriota bacterium]|nr:L-threonylcarbamoyladenylate synthase [Acidobacteriota bacterium]
MGTRLRIHPVTPQRRFVERAANVLRDHGVVILPTGDAYAFTALPGSRQAMESIAQIKKINPDKKLFSLIVPDLSDVARYALVDNHDYRIVRRFLPGSYTFVLRASREVPRILLAKRKTIGLRIPDHAVARRVAEAAGGALMATTVLLPGDEVPLSDPDEIESLLIGRIDLFLDAGWGGADTTTVIDLTETQPALLREGAGDPAPFR